MNREVILNKGNRSVWFIQKGYDRKVVTYTNHGIAYSIESICSVSKEEGNRYYKNLKNNGYRVISLEEFNNLSRTCSTIKFR